MIDGLKLAMRGSEVISMICERVEHLRSVMALESDAVKKRQHKHGIIVLTTISEHILPSETYLLRGEDLALIGMFPETPRPPNSASDCNEHTHGTSTSLDIGVLVPASGSARE